MSSNQITVRQVPERNIVVTADETGLVYVNGHATSQPIVRDGLTFVWAPSAIGAPKGTRISLPVEAVAMIDAHAAAFRERSMQAWAKRQKQVRDYGNLQNEGGEGYNPHVR